VVVGSLAASPVALILSGRSWPVGRWPRRELGVWLDSLVCPGDSGLHARDPFKQVSEERQFQGMTRGVCLLRVGSGFTQCSGG